LKISLYVQVWLRQSFHKTLARIFSPKIGKIAENSDHNIDQKHAACFLQWLNENKLIESIIGLLNDSNGRDVHDNAANLLVLVLSIEILDRAC
jgi:hypothetical protein